MWFKRSALIVALAAAGCHNTLGPDGDVAKDSKALPEVVAQYCAAGLPWVQADLNDKAPPPDQNAAPLLDRVFRSGFVTNWSSETFAAESGDTAQAKAELRPVNNRLNEAVEASSKPRLYYGHDWDVGFFVTFPELSSFKSLTKALCLRALVEAKGGHPSECVRDLEAAHRLGSLLFQDPSLISFLVRIACDAIFERAAENCMASFANDPATLKEIQACLDMPVPSLSLAKALQMEAFFPITLCRNFPNVTPEQMMGPVQGTGDTLTPPAHIVRDGYPSTDTARAELSECLLMWIDLAPALKSDDPFAIAKEKDSYVANLEKHPTRSSLLTRSIGPPIDQVANAVTNDKAGLTVIRALCAALLFKHEHGRYPASLSQIPGEWTDPYTGQPLKLIEKNGGVRIYSLGPDKKDNGGVSKYELPTDKRSSNDGWDIVAAYPPIPHRS